MQINVVQKNILDRIDWKSSIPFILVHLIAIVGIFFVSITWQGIVLCLSTYAVGMAAVTIGYHRYFSHRSFKTYRWIQFVLAFLSEMSVQKGVLWWASHHRQHHRFSDQEQDVHSPKQRGFLWAHVGWILSSRYRETKFELIKDFAKYPELVWINKHYLVPVIGFSGALILLGGWPAFYWGFILGTVVLWHGTFTVNSLAHVWGRRRYQTVDTSRNNLWIALITLGEGWHNNHHHYMNSAKQGFFWWEVDVSYYVLKFLSKLGLVWDVRVPPREVLRSS